MSSLGIPSSEQAADLGIRFFLSKIYRRQQSPYKTEVSVIHFWPALFQWASDRNLVFGMSVCLLLYGSVAKTFCHTLES